MRTLVLHDVPDDVVERLERWAAREATYVGALAVLRESSEASRRADNAVLLGALPNLGVAAADIIAAVDAGRAGS
jgi:hypothetical protein